MFQMFSYFDVPHLSEQVINKLLNNLKTCWGAKKQLNHTGLCSLRTSVGNYFPNRYLRFAHNKVKKRYFISQLYMFPCKDEIYILYLTNHMWETTKWRSGQPCKHPGSSYWLGALLKDMWSWWGVKPMTFWSQVGCPTTTPQLWI